MAAVLSVGSAAHSIQEKKLGTELRDDSNELQEKHSTLAKRNFAKLPLLEGRRLKAPESTKGAVRAS